MLFRYKATKNFWKNEMSQSINIKSNSDKDTESVMNFKV